MNPCQNSTAKERTTLTTRIEQVSPLRHPEHVERFSVRSVVRSSLMRSSMPTVKVSSKYQVVIPREIRDIVKIKPGVEVDVQAQEGNIVLVLVRPMKEMRGFLRGIDTSVERETDRRI